MSFKNSGYTILDNTRSIVVQLDSKYLNHGTITSSEDDKQIEDRGCKVGLFPTIDIKNGQPNALLQGIQPET
jgi:hypothetical protein